MSTTDPANATAPTDATAPATATTALLPTTTAGNSLSNLLKYGAIRMVARPQAITAPNTTDTPCCWAMPIIGAMATNEQP